MPVIAVLIPSDTSSPERMPPGLDAFEGRAEVRITDPDGLPQALEGADALFLWDFFSEAVESAWPHADRLQWIHVAAAGVDKLMFDELAASQVTVTNAQGFFDRPIAEFVLGAVLAQAKEFALSHRYRTERRWVHRETRRIQGQRAMIIGTGAIGRETARLLRAVGMEVRGVGRTARREDPDFGDVVSSEELAEHAGWADHLINAAPLTPQTAGLISAEILAAMNPEAHLVNIGRGESVDEPALIEALQTGGIGFASLDVFAEEPLPQDSALWDLDNVLISPHMSGDVVGWSAALAEQFVENAERWLAGETLNNIVDKDRGYVPRH
ncbi:D-2-hydroxyacid dehydrogenase [Nesterenkonia lacusekhoensis]|uniref:Phosphoglycerate dehydrogenase-like enzyme n=1 Tax=Nesterenkonia lacusekhoensis TaxID=150832 RepID=A0ABS4T2Y8_9MICC|nr:D-2-hydroxyacid dehydrogenase [Nesterenkonia lacusekhoensis]MBP2318813.1 phosphoglycerate dehydrogenase-like enzyme [Nesterenkonia lacusekhoensis]